MLDLALSARKLTQGQPPAAMTLLAPPRGHPAAAGAATPPRPAAPGAAPPPGDPETLARRVYELMRQELTTDHERRGRRPL